MYLFLDLSWNGSGLLGGRALLDCFQQNRFIVSLEVTGNNIPNDVGKALAAAVNRNQDRRQLESTYSSQTLQLAGKLEEAVLTRKAQISELLDKLESQRIAYDNTIESLQQHILHLQGELAQESSERLNLQAKFSTTCTSLQVSTDQVYQLEVIVEQLRAECRKTKQEHSQEKETLETEICTLQSKLRSSQLASSTMQDEHETTAKALERKYQSVQLELVRAREDIQQAHQTAHQRETEHQGKQLVSEQKHLGQLQAIELHHQEEINTLRQNAAAGEQSLREQLRQAQSENLRLEQDVSLQKTASAHLRASLNRDMELSVEKCQQEHRMRCKRLEEQLEMATTERQSIQTQLLQRSSAINQLKDQANAKEQEMEEERKTHRMKIKSVENECVDLTNKLETQRQQNTEQCVSLQERASQVKTLQAQLTQITQTVEDMDQQSRTRLAHKQREVEVLTDRLKEQEVSIGRMREAELRRANHLEAAMTAYVSSTKSAHIGSPIKLSPG